MNVMPMRLPDNIVITGVLLALGFACTVTDAVLETVLLFKAASLAAVAATWQVTAPEEEFVTGMV